MNVLFHTHFTKAYKKLDQRIQAQFKKRLAVFVQDPFHPLLDNHALHGEWQDFRSINITGDFRAFYQMVDEYTVEFFVLDTHSNLY